MLIIPLPSGCRGEKGGNHGASSSSGVKTTTEEGEHHLAKKPLKLLTEEKSRALLLQEGIEQAEQRSLNYKHRLNASQFLPKPTLTKPKNERALSLEEATKDLKGNGPIKVVIQTSRGDILCQIDPSKPETTEAAAHFVTLARGQKSWWNRRVSSWAKQPFFDDTVIYKIFNRKGFYGGFPPEAGDSQLAIPSLMTTAPTKKIPAYTLGMLFQKGTKLLDTNFVVTAEHNTFLDAPFFPIAECAESGSLIDALVNSSTTGDGIPIEEIRVSKISFSRQ